MLYTKRKLISRLGKVFFVLAFICSIASCRKTEKGISKQERTETNKTPTLKAVPKLIIKEGNHLDIGTVREGTNPRVSFTLINKGAAEATIAIDDLSKGGCTAVSMIPRIPPGDSSKLEFIFETLGYGGRSDTRRIRINYNNPVLRPLEISVSAKILSPKPYQAAIGEVWYNFYVLIDVRSHDAFSKEHLVGSINVPFKELKTWVSHLPKYLLIYLISEDGVKSDRAAKMLRRDGFSECVSLVGGLKEWKRRYHKKKLLISGTM